MRNFELWCALAILGFLLGKEFLDWVWWYNWEEEDEENPARLLCTTWRVWCKLRDAYFWLWSRAWGPPLRRLKEIWRRPDAPEPYYEPVDQDGRTPTEWLLIAVIGVWEMKDWYGGGYDWEVKARWDEILKTRNATERLEEEELRSAEPPD